MFEFIFLISNFSRTGCVNGTKDVQHRLRILMDSSSIPTKCSLPGGASPPRRFNCDESQFKVHRGVKAFDFCKESNILVTGGLDRNIRLWNPYVPGWAIGLLRGHTSPISFLCIADGNTKLFSVSMDSTVMVWDIEDQSCLLTVIPKASQIRGEMAVCYFSNELTALYLAADCLVLLRFRQKEDRRSKSCVSHNEPILCCQYNKPFRQVVSCSEGSAIKVWDFQNGQLVTEVYEAHGDAAVTCMALDTSGKRLITGGRDGSLKKWDCSTIRYIHTLKQGSGITNSLSTSLIFCMEQYEAHTLICSPFKQALQVMKSPPAHMLIFTATGTSYLLVGTGRSIFSLIFIVKHLKGHAHKWIGLTVW
uniref:Uncharacterized protein n=1 Tax=Terrapene triunguis TaxID=2587831 RepID=A0A674JBW0_9SAUR